MNSPQRPVVITREPNGRPSTLRLAREARRQAAYRRLAIAMLGLDVATLATELRRPMRLAA